ncbi:hypothetical protein NKH71_03330 [Mesorhizobium sp. M0983]|uniref:hypothetical protein n=1 Tax=Mesorhizobium sp. M0983 TaxID=2957040 RepID=UPI003336F523
MSYDAILEIPNVVVVPGPAGQSLFVVQDAADLAADFGRDDDRAIIRATGAEWLKTAGAWAATGANFWGTLLPQAAAMVELARRWAEEAPDVDVDGGFSALHWAGRSQYWATRPEVITVSMNIAAVLAASDNMAAIIDAPAQATAASTAAGQALGYKNTASTKADLAAAWAEGTLPGGAGTKSAKEWAEVSTTSVLVIVECSDETTPVLAQTGLRFGRFPYAGTIQDVRIELGDSQTSGALFTVDLKVWNGAAWVSIFSTKPTVDNGELTSVTAAIQRVISTSAITDDQQYRIDVTQIGSGDALGLKVKIYLARA